MAGIFLQTEMDCFKWKKHRLILPDIIYLCEGVSHTITVTDISTWNCQTPNVPTPLNPADYDNDKPRTLQFVYGETPAGAVMNTITGNVIIGGINIANAANGYVGPVITPVNPPNPNTVSETIMIPATSVARPAFLCLPEELEQM